MGPFLLYEDRYLISRTPVIESVYGVREYIPEPGATSAGDQQPLAAFGWLMQLEEVKND